MAKQCEVCGKGPQMGNQVTLRGKKKYLGGVGTKVTGITRRQFKPNLQKVKVTGDDGKNTPMAQIANKHFKETLSITQLQTHI